MLLQKVRNIATVVIGKLGYKAVYNINNSWEIWSGTGADNAPLGLPSNTIGFDQDAIGASNLFFYNSVTDAWTATTQTRDGFVGL